jgi:hypothetical protein
LLYVFTCLYNYTDIVLCTAYFVLVFVLTFPHPGLYWIYGSKDDDDDDDVLCDNSWGKGGGGMYLPFLFSPQE